MKKSTLAILFAATCVMACGCSDSNTDTSEGQKEYAAAIANPNAQAEKDYTANGLRYDVEDPITIQWCQTVYAQEEVSLRTGLHAYAQVFANGITGLGGTHDGLIAQVGYFQQAAFANADGDEALNYIYWADAERNMDFDGSTGPANDEYMVHGSPLKAVWGRSRVFFRFSGDGGYNWTYCGSKGIIDFTVADLLKYAQPFSIEFKTSSEMLEDIATAEREPTVECTHDAVCEPGFMCFDGKCIVSPEVTCSNITCPADMACVNGACVNICNQFAMVLDTKTGTCVCDEGYSMTEDGNCIPFESSEDWELCDNDTCMQDGKESLCGDLCREYYGPSYSAWCSDTVVECRSEIAQESTTPVVGEACASDFAEVCVDNTGFFCFQDTVHSFTCEAGMHCEQNASGQVNCAVDCNPSENGEVTSYSCQDYKDGLVMAFPQTCGKTKSGSYASFMNDPYEICEYGCSETEGCLKPAGCDYYDCSDAYAAACKVTFNTSMAICDAEHAYCVDATTSLNCAPGETAIIADDQKLCVVLGNDSACLDGVIPETAISTNSTVAGSACDPDTYEGACSEDGSKRYFCGKNNTVVEKICASNKVCAVTGHNASTCEDRSLPAAVPASCDEGDEDICANKSDAYFCYNGSYHNWLKCSNNGCFVCSNGQAVCDYQNCPENDVPAQTGGNAGDACNANDYIPSCINGGNNALVCTKGVIKEWSCANAECSYNPDNNRVTCPKPADF